VLDNPADAGFKSTSECCPTVTLAPINARGGTMIHVFLLLIFFLDVLLSDPWAASRRKNALKQFS
jgi:hypothetical protein